MLLQQLAFSQLCRDCSNISCQDFRRNIGFSQLRKSAESCELCRMLLQCLDLDQSSASDQEGILLHRDGSMLKKGGYQPPVLRLCVAPGM
jgi:hypothetical protein